MEGHHVGATHRCERNRILRVDGMFPRVQYTGDTLVVHHGKTMPTLTVEQKIRIRAAANEWISQNLPTERKLITHTAPEYVQVEQAWSVDLTTKVGNSRSVIVGHLLFNSAACVVKAQDPESISSELARFVCETSQELTTDNDATLLGKGFEFTLGDGIEYSKTLTDKSVDLLLTDPPYGISNAYTCEDQVPRRLRKNGADFIMPRGHFGDWDGSIQPNEWTEAVLPKVRGWAVIFCAQAQIGEYSDILKSHRFNAVGTLVWYKTNPVPFNHNYKPINAWEALVVGKRPGTKFNGSVVHNVFRCKSPSPQHRIHPTQKPLQLIEKFIELFSDEGDLIFDPFAGSGTAVIAAHRLHRRVLAYEKDADIYRLACNRITELVNHAQRF